MITNINSDFDDYDEQSKNELSGYKFLDLNSLKTGVSGEDPFKNIRTNKSFREMSNEIALSTPFGKRSTFYKPIYVEDNIDFPKLVELITDNKDVEFYWENYIGYTTKTVKYNYSSGGMDGKIDRFANIPTSYTEEQTVKTENPLKTQSFIGEKVLNLKGRINKEVNIVNIKADSKLDLTSGLEFEFNSNTRTVNYKLHFYYINKARVTEANNKNNIAFTISSSSYEDFDAFLKLSKLKYKQGSNFETKIKETFIKTIDAVNKLDNKIPNSPQRYNEVKFSKLRWLYSNIPEFVAKQIDFNQTISNVFQLSFIDKDSWILDTTKSITTVLRKLDRNVVYNYFYKNPQKLISLFAQFSDDALVEQFCQYLTGVVLIKQGENTPSNIRTFSLGENTHIESNILFGDPNGKVELVNEMQRPTFPYPFIGVNIINTFKNDIEINNPKKESNLFHPLDIIYISHFDKTLNDTIEIPTIALYGKYLGDKGEWSDVITATSAVIDVISIVSGFGVLAKGITGIVRLFTILDIAISTINLVTLSSSVKNALNKTDAGKWFVSHWPLISLCASSGMISVYLARGIIKHGDEFKGQLKSHFKAKDDIHKKIDELVEESEGVIKKRNKEIDELFSKIKGVPIDLKLLKKLQKEFKDIGGIMKFDEESFMYCASREKVLNTEIEAVTLGHDLILLNKNVTISAVYEELIHARQFRSGRFSEAVIKYKNKKIVDNLMEKEAAEELIKNSVKLKLPKEEVKIVKERLNHFNNELKKLKYEE